MMIKRTIEWEGRALTLETGRLANQANGSVLVSLGSTSVLCTVVCKKDPEEGVDFFPLSVHYQEKYFPLLLFEKKTTQKMFPLLRKNRV